LPPPVDLGPRGRTFAFPFGLGQVFGAKDACRDKCSVRCGDDACCDKCSVLCGDGSCKLNPQRRCDSRPTRMRRGRDSRDTHARVAALETQLGQNLGGAAAEERDRRPER
jgi:hypothetical protein